MRLRDKKLEILKLLGQENTPIGLPEILNKLPAVYAERSIRRWLNELVDECLVEKSGRRRGTKYQVIKKDVVSAKDASSCFRPESIGVIAEIRRPIYERQPIAYNDNWFHSYRPNIDYYIPDKLRTQLKQAGIRSNANDPAGTYAHQIFNRLLIDLSYNSSRLEGNTYSLLDTERLLLSGTSAEGKLDEEKIMILNHKEAIRYLVDNAKRINVSFETICTFHYLLADGLVESKYAGKVRDHSVRIGGSTYMPFDDPKQLLEQLNNISHKASSIKDPFEQSLFLLVHVSYLQAFSDVNKRTARLCANIPLVTRNLVPLSFNDVERDDYMSAIIAIYELQNVHPIVDLYAFSYMRTCAAYDSTLKAMGFDEVRVRYRRQRRDLLRDIILDFLVGNAMVSRIETETQKLIPESDRKTFIDDVVEDLEEIDQSRIAGLGITPDQLNAWLKFRKNHGAAANDDKKS